MTDLKKNIEQSLEFLFKVEGQPPKKKLLVSKAKIIYLQIVLFKIPFVPSPMKKYLNLRHSLYGDEPEICLFVPNRKTGVEYKKTTDELIDFCVDYYTELLEKHKIKGISTIMPLKQLRSEYGAYEMRRKLVRRYDLFLCKNSLLFNHRFLTSLGKIFKDANREPLGVTFPKEDSDYDPEFQKRIDKAIFASSFVIKRYSDNYTIPIGTLSNTKSELKENLETVLDQLIAGKMIPGGVQNVRMLNLWPSQSKPIPLFINPELPPKDKNPRAKTRRKKKMPVAVEGEISTQPGKKVFVMPNGEVFVTSIDNKKQEDESESDDSFKDGSEVEDEEEESKNEKLKRMAEKDENNSEIEDDEEIEAREQKLLREKRKAEGEAYGKLKSIRTEEDEEEELSEELEMPKKTEKAKKGKVVKKSNRKMLMKQKKLKTKENKKSKQKKV